MHFFPTISRNPTVHILYLTFNRLYYTQKTLPVLLESSDTASYQIYIVDNGSTDGTVEYLQNLNHPRIEKVVYNKKNEGLVKPTKKFWAESNAGLVGKIDNDILISQLIIIEPKNLKPFVSFPLKILEPFLQSFDSPQWQAK